MGSQSTYSNQIRPQPELHRRAKPAGSLYTSAGRVSSMTVPGGRLYRYEYASPFVATGSVAATA